MPRSMPGDASDESEPSEGGTRRLFVRALLLGLGLLGLLVGGVAVVSIVSDESEPLPFRYEGFD